MKGIHCKKSKIQNGKDDQCRNHEPLRRYEVTELLIFLQMENENSQRDHCCSQQNKSEFPYRNPERCKVYCGNGVPDIPHEQSICIRTFR